MLSTSEEGYGDCAHGTARGCDHHQLRCLWVFLVIRTHLGIKYCVNSEVLVSMREGKTQIAVEIAALQ